MWCVGTCTPDLQLNSEYMSIATLAGGSLTDPLNRQSAPRLAAGVFARGIEFSSGKEYEGLNAMSQPATNVKLFAGDTGLVGRDFAVRSYGVGIHENATLTLLVVASELCKTVEYVILWPVPACSYCAWLVLPCM